MTVAINVSYGARCTVGQDLRDCRQSADRLQTGRNFAALRIRDLRISVPEVISGESAVVPLDFAAAGIKLSDAVRNAFETGVAGFPRIFGIEEEYAQAMRRAELAWVRATAAELRDGTFPWPSREDLPEYPP